MGNDSNNSWPTLGDGYSDEFGRIEPEVYQAAKDIWPEAEVFARAKLGDGAAGKTLMAKAAASVSRVYIARPHEVDNLNAYLFKSYKHLILAELRKMRLHDTLTAGLGREAANLSDTPAEELDRKILIEQLMLVMDEWTRDVFELLVLGYTFDEIGRQKRMLAASVRNKFNKHLKRLVQRLNLG